MSERVFRTTALILLAIYVAGSLYFDFVTSENGRYIQYDKRGEYSPDGKTHMQNPAFHAFDTRTGKTLAR